MADRTALPPLYSLADIAMATGWSLRTVQRKLATHPEIRPIGKGKCRRYTAADYLRFIDQERAEKSGATPARLSNEEFKHSIHSDARTLAKDLRASMFP